MSVTLAMVISVNGHITNGTDASIYSWTSKQDQEHFFNLIKTHSIIIMGSKTYSENKSVIKLEPGKLRIVLTHTPSLYETESVAGQLEFTNENPEQLMARLATKTPSKILVVGGSQICTQFLTARLIDRLLLTVEPHIFGQGTPFIHPFTYPQQLAVKLKLIDVKQLNSQGTLLLEYEVVN